MCSDLFRYLAKQLLVSRMLIDVSHYLLIEHLKADKMNIREDFFKLLIITQQCYVVTSVLYLLDVHIFFTTACIICLWKCKRQWKMVVPCLPCRAYCLQLGWQRTAPCCVHAHTPRWTSHQWFVAARLNTPLNHGSSRPTVTSKPCSPLLQATKECTDLWCVK